jgi:hypothetical protein
MALLFLDFFFGGLLAPSPSPSLEFLIGRLVHHHRPPWCALWLKCEDVINSVLITSRSLIEFVRSFGMRQNTVKSGVHHLARRAAERTSMSPRGVNRRFKTLQNRLEEMQHKTNV